LSGSNSKFIGELNETFDDLQILRTRFSNPITRPRLTKFVYGLTQLLFTDEEIMLPLKNINKQKIDWIYDETFQIFDGCTYSTIKMRRVTKDERSERQPDVELKILETNDWR